MLKFTHGRKYQKKKIEIEKKNDPRILQILLFKSEHEWAYAMDIK
jgi:signal recognition particle subunit SRP68